jgi:hypothetical protein
MASTKDQGGIMRTNFFKGRPKVLFHSQTEVISISVMLQCDRVATCDRCSLSKTDEKQMRDSHQNVPRCPMSKRIEFRDSCKMLTFSLNQLVSDAVQISNRKSIDLSAIFPNTLDHLISQGYDEDTFKYLLTQNAKMQMPFEVIDSLSYLQRQTIPPPRSAFKNTLSNTLEIPEDSYALFLQTWNKLKISSLYQLFRLYLALDVIYLGEVLAFYFQTLFSHTKLYPSHFQTISSLGLAATLLNSPDPDNPKERLKIPFLDESSYELFCEALIGGFSSVNAKYCNWNPMSKHEIDGDSKNASFGCFVDVNALYPSVLTGHLPFKNYQHFSRTENPSYFDFLIERLLARDTDYFYKLQMSGKGVLFKLELEIPTGSSQELNLDFASFPIREAVSEVDLSLSQRKVANLLRRSVNSEPKKLQSRVGKNIFTTDYCENLLYLLIVHKAKISQVFKACVFESAAFLKKHMENLQHARAEWSPYSKVLSQTIKSLGNTVTGKLHSKIEAYCNIRFCTDKKTFLGYLDCENFVDFTYLNDKSCVVKLDGISIRCKNLPTISSRVYSMSKLYLWKWGLVFQSRLRFFSNGGSTRLALTDTGLSKRSGGPCQNKNITN